MPYKMQYALVPTDVCPDGRREGHAPPQNPCSTVFGVTPHHLIRQSQESVLLLILLYYILNTRACQYRWEKLLQKFFPHPFQNLRTQREGVQPHRLADKCTKRLRKNPVGTVVLALRRARDTLRGHKSSAVRNPRQTFLPRILFAPPKNAVKGFERGRGGGLLSKALPRINHIFLIYLPQIRSARRWRRGFPQTQGSGSPCRRSRARQSAQILHRVRGNGKFPHPRRRGSRPPSPR